ncbi:cytochrome c oxidase subunit 4 isoform 1, mitochondrial-like isoform X1 [Belonocnema kinseyi]|uniref:cytochrome c oxidase subunit 4 isoform 1, mitochondrial-like isoform X1 n=1 Tax=Belonocnema kinseyi TaxID=2817044 RepID=UPI00143DDAD9|nr:cytochrome c oxidase subunit 4 isoform 1, mitochondrial-like isoform X1 [Belonocnema kinseyi]
MSLWRKVALKSLDFRKKLLLTVRIYNHEAISQKELIWKKIENQEIVRFGLTCQPSQALREKEKGDWNNLTIDEKMCLYRDSFSNTSAEVVEPTPEWKSVMAWTIFLSSLGIWLYIFIRLLLERGNSPSMFDKRRRVDSVDQYYRAIEVLMKKEAVQKEARE